MPFASWAAEILPQEGYLEKDTAPQVNGVVGEPGQLPLAYNRDNNVTVWVHTQ